MDQKDNHPDPLKLGVIGLGRGFMLTLPALTGDRRVQLAGAATSSRTKQQAFEEQFGARAYDTFDALCADDDIDAIYVATPHATHRGLAIQALEAGKHVLVEKPMTISVADAEAMVRAAERSGREIIVGPSHSFDTPIVETGKLIASGKFGPVGMIHAHYFTDFVFRPRRKEELDRRLGGGAVFNQGAHHVDILLTLAGSSPTSVYGCVGNLDSRRPCDGAYSAIIEFANGCYASITYSGYAHYDSDADLDWVGELGSPKNPDDYGAARRRLGSVDEVAEKGKRGFAGLAGSSAPAKFHEHFGNVLASCQKADLRPTAKGIHVYADESRDFIALPVEGSPRTPVVSELYELVRHGVPPVHSAKRGLLTVAVCEAIYESARLGKRIAIQEAR